MRAYFQPYIDAEVRQLIDCCGKLHGLPHASPPVNGGAGFARATPAGDGAEERYRVGVWCEIGECFLEFLGRWLHQRVMKGMIDTDKPSEDSLRLHLGQHCFERNARTREGQRTWTVEGSNCDGAI